MGRRLLRRDVDRSVLLTCRRPAPGRTAWTEARDPGGPGSPL